MHKCSVCEKEFEDKYFYIEQNKCILHCEKNYNFENYKEFYEIIIKYLYQTVHSNINYEDNSEKVFQEYIELDKVTSFKDLLKKPDKHVIFKNIHFPINGSLNSEYNYIKIINKFENIEFKNCYFNDILFFSKDRKLKFEKCNFYDDWQHILCDEVKYLNCKFENFIIDNISINKYEVNNTLLYNCDFEKIDCSGAIFQTRLFKFDNLNKYKYIKELKFINCEFKEDFILNVTDNDSENDDEIEYFKIDNLDLTHSTFEKKVKIQFCDIAKTASFYNTKFKDLADFYRTKFQEVDFRRTDFEKISVFSEVEFNKNVDFKYTKFIGKAIFRDAVIKGELNLRNTIFDEEANFLDISSEKRRKIDGRFIGILKDIDVSNRETARIIKNFYEKSNNIIEANKFYSLELREREKELDTENLQDLLIFKLHNIISEHSQNWLLVLMWITLFSWFFSINIIYKNSDVSLFFYFLSTASFGLFNWFLNSCFYKEYLLKAFLRIIFIFLVVFISFQYAMSSGLDKELLNQFVLNVNPFSKIGDKITLVELVYKIFMGYLIYQFIISVRQNTRRK